MQVVDEFTRQRFYDLSLLVNDVSGGLAPEIVAISPDANFNHALFLYPSPLRSIVSWAEQDVWMYRFLELNIVDGTVWKLGEVQQLAPVGHELLPELTARMLATCAREIVTNVTDRIIVPRDRVDDVFDAHVVQAAKLSFAARTWLFRNGFRPEW